MIVPTVGLPGRFAEWCEALVFELAAAASPQPQIFPANSLDDIGREYLARNCANAVAVAREPRASLRQSLLAGNMPFLLLLQPPDACAAALVKDHDYELTRAVRFVANCCAAVMPLARAPNALVLRADGRRSGEDIARAVAGHFHLGLEDEAIRTAAAAPHVAALAARFHTPLEPPAETVASGGTQDNPGAQSRALLELLAARPAANMADDALEPFWRGFADGELREVVWHRQLFQWGDRPSAQLPEIIDVTGPARCLAFGPYIQLPAGSWSCSLMLGCSEDAAGLRMNVEAFTDVPLNRVAFELGEPGLFEIEFSFVLANADVPVQIRLFSADAAFEGKVALAQARMTPLKARRLPVSAA